MKNVLITGGAGGIGSEVVKKFADNGYFVYFVDIDKDNAIKLEKTIGEDRCKFINLDVTNVANIKKYCDAISNNFSLNHIVTLAGRALPNEWKSFEEQTLNDLYNSVHINLLGHINI